MESPCPHPTHASTAGMAIHITHTIAPTPHAAFGVVLNGDRKWRAGVYIMFCRDLDMRPKLCSFEEIYRPRALQIWSFLQQRNQNHFFLPFAGAHWRKQRVSQQPSLQEGFATSQMWLWSRRPHALAIQPIMLMAATNLLCWALMLGAFLKLSPFTMPFCTKCLFSFHLPTALGIMTPIYRSDHTIPLKSACCPVSESEWDPMVYPQCWAASLSCIRSEHLW